MAEKKTNGIAKPMDTWFFQIPGIINQKTLPPFSNMDQKIYSKTSLFLDAAGLKSLFDQDNINHQLKRKRRFNHKLNDSFDKQDKRHERSELDEEETIQRTFHQTKNKSKKRKMKNSKNSESNLNSNNKESIYKNKKNINKTQMNHPFISEEELNHEKNVMANQLGLTIEDLDHLESALNENNTLENSIIMDDYIKVFEKYDKDGSGSISPNELRNMLKEVGDEMDEIEIQDLINQADGDGNGEIDFNEFVQLMKARKRLLAVAKLIGTNNSNNNNNNKNFNEKKVLDAKSNTSSSLPLPPLKLADVQSKKHLQKYDRYFGRVTPSCLRPGYQVDIVSLKKELAIAEYGLKVLDYKVKENVQWVQQHCPVTSIKAQLFCQKWGAEKMSSLFKRIQLNLLIRGFRKWLDYNKFSKNKEIADKYMKCKGGRKMKNFIYNYKRKKLIQAWNSWLNHKNKQTLEEKESAAIEIQRCIHGFLGRRSVYYLKRNIAATKIQKIIRGKIARIYIKQIRKNLLENKSAYIIQRNYRIFLDTRLNNMIQQAKLKNKKAIIIQNCFKKYHNRSLFNTILKCKKRNIAVIKIQKKIRGKLARNMVHKLRLERKQDISATKIQKIQRGYNVRKYIAEARKNNNAATKIQKRIRGILARKYFIKLKKEKAEKIYLKKQNIASSKIQAFWNGCKVRYSYHLRLLDKKTIEKEEEMRQIKHAILIQSTFRGYLARLNYKILEKEMKITKKKIMMNDKALLIQKIWKKYICRKYNKIRKENNKKRFEEKNRSAVKIQKIVRGMLARKTLRKLKQDKIKLILLYKERENACIKIQSFLRGIRGRKIYKKLKKEKEIEAKKALDRLKKENSELAAIKIQSLARGYICRKAYKKKLIELEKKKQETINENKREKAAIIIQRHVRKRRAEKIERQKKKDYEERLAIMAANYSANEIAKLKKQQEEEIAKMKMELLLEKELAEKEAIKLRMEADKRLQEEKEKINKIQNDELLKLKLQNKQQEKIAQDTLDIKRKQFEQERNLLTIKHEKEKREMIEIEKRKEEEKILLSSKISNLLQIPSRDINKEITSNKEQKNKNENENENLEATDKDKDNDKDKDKDKDKPKSEDIEIEKNKEKNKEKDKGKDKQDVLLLQKEKEKIAALKLQKYMRKFVSKYKIKKIKDKQKKELEEINNEKELNILKVKQEKLLAEAKLKALLEQETHENEMKRIQENIELLAKEKHKKDILANKNILKINRNNAANKIKRNWKIYIGKKKIKKLKNDIEKERQKRLKADKEAIEKISNNQNNIAMHNTSLSETIDLNHEWMEYWDENAQATYYYNIRTQEATWTRPDHANYQEQSNINGTFYQITDKIIDYEADNNGYGFTEGQQYVTSDIYGYYDEYGQYHYYDTLANQPYTDINSNINWQKFYDQNTGAPYYYNAITGETQWA